MHILTTNQECEYSRIIGCYVIIYMWAYMLGRYYILMYVYGNYEYTQKYLVQLLLARQYSNMSKSRFNLYNYSPNIHHVKHFPLRTSAYHVIIQNLPWFLAMTLNFMLRMSLWSAYTMLILEASKVLDTCSYYFDATITLKYINSHKL